MNKFSSNKGIALLTVLVVLLVVVALAEGILQIMLNQSRLTHHNVSRIQAYYAAMAGMKLAYENLRTNSWPTPTVGNPVVWHCMSLNGVIPQCAGDTAPIVEPNLPGSIQFVFVRVAIGGAPTNNPATIPPLLWPECNPPAGVNTCVNARAVYTFQ